MPDRTKYALTEAQREHLARIRDAAAFDRPSGVTGGDSRIVGYLNPGVIGILIDKGLAQKSLRRRGGRALTVYWLTQAGLEQLAALEGGA